MNTAIVNILNAPEFNPMVGATSKNVVLCQGWGTRGPRATCGPRNVFKRPASQLCNCNVKTACEHMRTKHGLHPCYVMVAGDVALVLVYASGFTLT